MQTEISLRIGFTGTQQGMSLRQKRHVREYLIRLSPDEFHHGDCYGADEEAHNIALDLGIAVYIHPPSDDKKRAYCKGATHIYPPYPYLVRNRHIVNGTHILIATPYEATEVLRSGTWSTIRYAKKRCKKPRIFTP